MPQRQAITLGQKSALRQQRVNKPEWSQKELCAWFEQRYGRPVKQSSVSAILSPQYLFLDAEDPNQRLTRPETKKRRREQYPDLENALYAWHQLYQALLPITGDMLKQKALELWRILPQYQNLPPPQFSNGWLDNFKTRKGIARTTRQAATESEPGHGNARSDGIVTASEALQHIRRLLIYEEQATDGSVEWMQELQRHEQVIRYRIQRSQEQRTLLGYLAANK